MTNTSAPTMILLLNLQAGSWLKGASIKRNIRYTFKRSVMYKIKRSMYIETAHMLAGHDGLCKHIHGHSYKISVEVKADTLSHDMVMDFSDLKLTMNKIINEFDHALVVDFETSLSRWMMEYDDKRVVVMEKRPTAERMAKYFYDRLTYAFPYGVSMHKVIVRETKGNEASYEEY